MSTDELLYWLGTNFKVMFSFIGGIQGVILAIVVLFYPRENKISNWLLSLFIFSHSHLLIINRVAEWLGHQYDWLLFSIQLLGIISLYLYIQSLHKKIKWKEQWWHILILFVDTLRIYFLTEIRNSGPEDKFFYSFSGTTFEYLSLLFVLLVYGLYLVLSLKEFRIYIGKAEKNYSDINRLGIQWVKNMIFGKYGLIVLDFMFLMVSFNFTDWYRPYHGIVNTLLYTVFMYYITVKGKLNPQIYQLRKIENQKEEREEILEQERNKDKVFSDDLQEIANNFVDLMENERLFKIEGLSVKDVADNMEVQAYLVSQAINNCLGKSFFDLVNGYRVEEAKKLMLDEKLNHLSMIGIGFEAGFNSKTAFNIAFKKHTGMTPSEFKRSQREV
jgi:AraC-like DNA-binding protein